MKFNDLRDFIDFLEQQGELKRISHPVDPDQQMTEIGDRVLRAQGPALLFENPIGYQTPVLVNLFGTPKRVALAMGRKDVKELRAIGEFLAFLKAPEPPKGFKAAIESLPLFRQVLNMPVKRRRHAPCQEIVWHGDAVDLDKLPVMRCWAEDVAPLLTWGLTITKGPYKKRQNLGIYRQQKIAKNKVIMRWLAHRGGALDLRDWMEAHPGENFPVSVVFGADPATILGAVTPVPDTLSEYAFAGLLRGGRTQVVKSLSNDLDLPASAEIVLEGYIDPNEFADEGPYGDHTGYYNEVERHHVFTVTHVTMRKNPIYHSTYTGRPPDEPAMLGVALNEVFVPILQKQFPEISDFYLPPEGCSYRLAVVGLKKQYPGHAKRVMLGVWSFLRQFMYTKYVIVCDESVNIRDWQAVSAAMSQHFSPKRDTVMIENTPIDSLDFASPFVGLGSKMGWDATEKWSVEQQKVVMQPKSENHAIYFRSVETLLKNQHPSIQDLYYPEHLSPQQWLIVAIDKTKASQAKHLIEEIWSQLGSQLVIICDHDVNIRDWQDVIWAITTRMDPVRDTLFWTDVQGQDLSKGSKMALDATNKLTDEVSREWGRPIQKDPAVVAAVDAFWSQLGLAGLENLPPSQDVEENNDDSL